MISVVIPAYNEADAIASTIESVREVLAKSAMADAEIVVVDDGSDDGTGGLATAAGARVVRNPHNIGYGASLKRGIAAAAHDVIVITDADMTYPIEEIPTLVTVYREGFDMVVGARTGPEYRGSLIKSPLRAFLKWLVELAAGRNIPDINSGFRVFSRATSMSYFNHLCDTFSFTTSMTLAYMMNSRFVAYRPIPYYPRRGKSKVRLFRDSLRTLQYILEAVIYFDPLKIYLLVAGLFLSMSGFSFLASIFTKLTVFYILGIGGIFLAGIVISIGMLAVLLKQIMIK